MGEFFHAYAELELHLNEEALVRYRDISSVGFGNSIYVKSQLATALYNIRGIVEYFMTIYCACADRLFFYWKSISNSKENLKNNANTVLYKHQVNFHQSQ